MDYLDGLLEKLTMATGVGYGGNISDVIVQCLSDESIPAICEKDGSVSAHLKGRGRCSIMLACHADEIGYMVSRIDDEGRIFLSEIGGADPRILPGQEVVVTGRRTHDGYIAAKPPHLLSVEDRKKAPRLEELFVDTGLVPSVVKADIQVGDYVTFAGRYGRLSGELRTVKALDNRSSVACGILVLKELVKKENDIDVYFVATSQEEYVGLGANIHAYRLPVDYSVVVDVSHAEHPDLDEYEYFPLNSGPTILRGATIAAGLFERLTKTAKKLKIPYQVEAVPSFTGTDADDIAFNRQGIPTCVINIPLRYMHTPVEVVSLKDIRRAASLIVHFIRGFS
jgi:putative aminopeptidase FrvX